MFVGFPLEAVESQRNWPDIFIKSYMLPLFDSGFDHQDIQNCETCSRTWMDATRAHFGDIRRRLRSEQIKAITVC
jgi:hypothetical protein